MADVCGDSWGLLIGCVNLANLQLARSVANERETAVRGALGANKVQVMMGLLMESLLLSVIGGAAGVMLAFGGVKFFIALAPENVPRLNEATVSLPVLIFACVLSRLAALSFGILPALRSLRVEPLTALQANSTRVANSHEGRRTCNLLVGTQVACTVVLLIVTSLVLRSFSIGVAQFLAITKPESRLPHRPRHARAGRSVRATV
ncbi:MAG: FtsX-like permease family protein [Terracidiphilus sp.]